MQTIDKLKEDIRLRTNSAIGFGLVLLLVFCVLSLSNYSVPRIALGSEGQDCAQCAQLIDDVNKNRDKIDTYDIFPDARWSEIRENTRGLGVHTFSVAESTTVI